MFQNSLWHDRHLFQSLVNWRSIALRQKDGTDLELKGYRLMSIRMMFHFMLLTITISLHCSANSLFAEVSFATQIRPILADKCWHCHGPDRQTREADLRLDVRDAAEHAIVRSDNTSSLLEERITSTDPSLRMPPADSKKALTADEIKLIQQWIAEGAPFSRHWAFISPEKPPIAESTDSHNSPIDHFITAKLESQHLTLSPRADKTTLIRRASLDLTGLPPSLEEIDAFLADESQDAFANMVDRLLASPAYGEHTARTWLDAARYADTDGYQNDRYRYMHVWRDWVIMAFNNNMPYDQFLTEQLAGDMLPNATLTQQIATGFCRNHRINSEDGSIPQEWHVENVVDRVDTLGTAILGLTIGCARCHDHKYDPISAREYYQLFAYFNNVPEWGIGPNNGNSPPFIKVPATWPDLSPEENVAQVPEPLKLSPARKEQGNGLKRPQPGNPQTVMVMQEMPEPRTTYLLVRGQYNTPDTSEPLTPNVPETLNTFNSAAPKNRLELARWLTHPQHPLTSRVAVNRVWQQLFGTGLVKTSENFGLQGELPTHPELLDWLAVTFVESGWDLKQLHRTIMLSETYQQSSIATPRLREIDPENRLLARAPRYRVHPFTLRDSALAASHLLVPTMYGPSAKPYMPAKIWSSISNNKYEQDHGDNLYRRSLYTYWRRTIPPPTMLNFNAAEREVCVVRKEKTNTPLQALTLMNNITFLEASRFLAERMLQSSDSPRDSIRHGFRLMTSHFPDENELQLLHQAYQEFQKNYALHPEQAAKLLQIGEKPRNEQLSAIDHAAMTMVASLIMNLDESMTRE